jgi:hypothetical protein
MFLGILTFPNMIARIGTETQISDLGFKFSINKRGDKKNMTRSQAQYAQIRTRKFYARIEV